ncbi:MULTISPECIES: signal peptidase II [Eubacteriales]|uniref:Lipoprotein signal peptidase n=1 Tax=Bittarella massiliensis (ex Durand et al. 2017) TaxID=1720313 RepID=A0AAQ1MBB6_9FIRM|nr:MULTISPECIES: signal peptidase II [Eubacteriales]ERJ00489.1 signal peptidase II [Clostridium sp. ATCC 29733]MZL68796.1 signal peptidase II [Bittarella massiliensis (ex Durand et al. 2017)]MZL81246.1 signal peptidase II [Bittarella massiliensis (ex Durand et al. 2017)]SHF72248.1 lipoprotein signal peptidase [Bittarella massiliensis (ex Durand et al. 2017)]
MGMLTILATCLALVAADQLLKMAAVIFLQQSGPIEVIPNVLGLTYVENRGAAFGMMEGSTTLLIAVTTVILVFGCFVLTKNILQNRVLNGCVLVVMAGGLGNLIDRIFRGCVIDYLQFQFIDFPVFNFADCLVVCGIVVMVVDILFFDKTFFPQKKEKKTAAVTEVPAQEVATAPVRPAEPIDADAELVFPLAAEAQGEVEPTVSAEEADLTAEESTPAAEEGAAALQEKESVPELEKPIETEGESAAPTGAAQEPSAGLAEAPQEEAALSDEGETGGGETPPKEERV